MKKLEKQFQTEFVLWAKENMPFDGSSPLEYKSVPGNSFNVKGWIKAEPHQPRSLMMAKTSKGIWHKISDQSQERKPFDALYYCNCEKAWVIVYFNGCERFAIMEVEYVLKFRDGSINTKQLIADGITLHKI